MSLTATILLIYAACLVGTIASSPASGDREERGTETRRLLGAVLVPALALLGIATTAPAKAGEAAPQTVSGPATVIDGGTLAVGGRRVRLYGIEAPDLDQTCFDAQEHSYPCGRRAAETLSARIGGESVTCEPRGAATALCRLGSDDLAAWMVSRGLAVADRSQSGDYTDQDQRAWGRRLGLWSGVFERPADRRRMRGATAAL